MGIPQQKEQFDSLASLKTLFGISERSQEGDLPFLIQAGMECMNIQLTDSLGQPLTPEAVESSLIDAFDTAPCTYDSVAVALVSMAAVVAAVDMPPSSRAAIEGIIHLNIAKLEEKLS